MNRPRRAHPEITGGLDQRLSGQPQPDAVGIHPGGERIGRAGNRLRQFQPSAALRKWLAVRPRQSLQKLTRHFFPMLTRTATLENHRSHRLCLVLHGHGPRRPVLRRGLVRVHFIAQPAQDVALRHRKIPAQTHRFHPADAFRRHQNHPQRLRLRVSCRPARPARPARCQQPAIPSRHIRHRRRRRRPPCLRDRRMQTARLNQRTDNFVPPPRKCPSLDPRHHQKWRHHRMLRPE